MGALASPAPERSIESSRLGESQKEAQLTCIDLRFQQRDRFLVADLIEHGSKACSMRIKRPLQRSRAECHLSRGSGEPDPTAFDLQSHNLTHFVEKAEIRR